MRIIFSLLLFVLSLNAHALEFEYKLIFFDIPNREISGVGVANMPEDVVVLHGKDWSMAFSDKQFESDCLLLAEKDDTISCKQQFRISMLDKITKENSPPAKVLFDNPIGYEIKRHEFENYILYSSAAIDKYSIALLVEKHSGRTIGIKGKFSDKHLKWLRLKSLESNK